MTILDLVTTVAIGLGGWGIYTLYKEIERLQSNIKESDRRYMQLYSAYAEECSSNPNRPHITTMAQEQWDATYPAKSATEFDLRKQGHRP